jgi:uncharacterized SAM-dependent methyltransferase
MLESRCIQNAEASELIGLLWVFFFPLSFFLSFRCRFAGIDVSGPFLEEACKNLIQEVDGLRLEDMDMVEADYMVGLKTIRERYPDENICILWLGSSVGNLSAADAVQFFQDAIAAIGSHCQLFLCTGR